MDPEYMQKIQKWVELDNKILKNKEVMKDFIETKKDYENSIIEYIDKNKQNNLVINISDGVIKFGSRNTTQNITLKFLKTVLEKYSVEKKNIDDNELYKYIIDNLEKKTVTVMSRDIKNQT